MGTNKKVYDISAEDKFEGEYQVSSNNNLTIKSINGKVIIDGVSCEIVSSTSTGAAFTVKDESNNVLFQVNADGTFSTGGATI